MIDELVSEDEDADSSEHDSSACDSEPEGGKQLIKR